MIRLAERTWPEAARLARDPRSVVLLPLGAIEQHGPHLPLLVDWLGAEELARRVAPHLRRGGDAAPLDARALRRRASPRAAASGGRAARWRRAAAAPRCGDPWPGGRPRATSVRRAGSSARQRTTRRRAARR